MAIALYPSIDFGMRNSVLKQMAEEVNAIGGTTLVIASTAGETHDDWIKFLRQIALAVNALGSTPPVPVYTSLDYNAFQSVVDNLITAINALSALPAVPTNTGVPVVTGNPAVGSTLASTTGTWNGAPTSFAYQWRRGTTNVGTNSPNYLVVAADVGAAMTCRVTASNAGGPSAFAASNAITIVAAPTNTTPPAVTPATAVVGDTLNCSTGAWTGTPTYAYQWLRGGANIAGATTNSHVTVAADGGTNVSCRVTGTNAGGAVPATSNTAAVT